MAYSVNTVDVHAVCYEPVCYVPEGNHCGAYREDEVSATLNTRYQYGGGGDGALVLTTIGYMSHDLFSTKFLKDGHTDPLAATDYKEPPVVAYIWDARGNGRGGGKPDHHRRPSEQDYRLYGNRGETE